MQVRDLSQKIALEVEGVELKVQDQLRVVGQSRPFKGTQGDDQVVTPAPVAWTDDDGMRIGLRLITELECLPSSSTPLTASAAPYVMFYDPVTDTWGRSDIRPEMFTYGTIQWGDGTHSNMLGEVGNIEHTYGEAGTYPLTVIFHFAAVPGVAQVFSPQITQPVTVS